jgi:3D (Asp-Asp-Asp) domain-containing protein
VDEYAELSAEESHDEEYEDGDNGQYESEVDSGLNEDEGWVYYGNCRITHYCPESCCCGEYATGYTANGSLATAGRTVATGEDIPFGTEVMINGQVYIAEDRGVDSGQIDIFVGDHQTALNMGMYYTDVYIRSAE